MIADLRHNCQRLFLQGRCHTLYRKPLFRVLRMGAQSGGRASLSEKEGLWLSPHLFALRGTQVGPPREESVSL